MRRPLPTLALALALAVGPLAACGSSDDDSAADGTRPAAEETTTTTAPAVAPIEVLVSNDDGYAAEGIDVLVEALTGVEGVTVTVVAPLTQQSGTGGSSTEGPLAVTDVTLASGHPAKAVDGFPSDSVRVAIDELGIEPDVVITGINEGANLGPIIDLSGTVGAARAAVARGVPALATSQGLASELDYDAAVPLILEWLAEHRAALADGSAPVEVANLNIPSCDEGELRGLVETTADFEGDGPKALAKADCTATVGDDEVEGDVELFAVGFATISPVPDEPAG